MKVIPNTTKEELIRLESKFGGFITGVKRNIVSNHDPRTEVEILTGGMTGGDRMSDEKNGYGTTYANCLSRYLETKEPKTIVEIGILLGTGLAVWSEVFPNARIIGLDIDTNHHERNKQNLLDRGAFSNGLPEVYTFDQFEDNKKLIKNILKGDTIDVAIDDGHHSEKSIKTTFHSISSFFSEDFLFFIEDNNSTSEFLDTGENYLINPHGKFLSSSNSCLITVVSNKK